jgi:hypothetical protein
MECWHPMQRYGCTLVRSRTLSNLPPGTGVSCRIDAVHRQVIDGLDRSLGYDLFSLNAQEISFSPRRPRDSGMAHLGMKGCLGITRTCVHSGLASAIW